MWYLIVSIPDLCTLTYFDTSAIVLINQLEEIGETLLLFFRLMGAEIAHKCTYNQTLNKKATFWKAKTVCYTQVAVLSRVSQNICHEVSLLSVRFITPLLSKEDLSILCLAYFSRFIKQKYMYVLCLMGISVVCVYTFFTFLPASL